MTERTAGLRASRPDQRSAGQNGAAGYDRAPTWARGAIIFAGIMMIMVGVFQAIAGLVGLFANDVYLNTRNYLLEFDLSAWGFIHLLVGAAVVTAGFAVLAGQAWGRVVGIVLVAISAVTNFTFIPYYPFWSLTIIALDVFVLWALAHYGRDVRL